FYQFCGFLGHFGVRFADVVDVPIGDGRGIGRQRRIVRRIEAEGYDFFLVLLSVGRWDQRKAAKMAAEDRLWSRSRGVADHIAEKSVDEPENCKAILHVAF